MTPTMLIAYDAAGEIVATLDYVVARGPDGTPLGLVDFAAHEAAGGKLRDIWEVSEAVGSATWPEWLGMAAHDFRIELNSDKRAVALVHKASGYRRDRAELEAAIDKRIERAKGGPADIRDLVGGPDRPLRLTSTGRNARPAPAAQLAALPILAKRKD